MKIQLKLIILFSFISSTLIAQDYTGKKVTLIQLSYSSETILLNDLDKYEPATSREKSKFAEVKEQLKIDIQNTFYDEFQKNIEATSITLEPRNALENYGILYTNGYPLVLTLKSGVKKAIKKGYTSDYFISAKLSTSADGGLMSSSSKIVNKFIAMAEVTIDIVNASGKKVKTVKYTESTPEKISNKDYFGGRFDKTDKENLERLQELYDPLIGIATKKAIEQL